MTVVMACPLAYMAHTRAPNDGGGATVTHVTLYVAAQPVGKEVLSDDLQAASRTERRADPRQFSDRSLAHRLPTTLGYAWPDLLGTPAGALA